VASFVARRAALSLAALFVASLIIFYGLRISPSSPENTLFLPNATPAARQALRNRLGLDQPIVVQYWHLLRDLAAGNLGTSIKSGQPIGKIIVEYGGRTLELVGAAALITYVFSVPLGIVAALRRNTWVDHLISGFASLLLGIPNFLLALLLILVFATTLGWLPVAGTGGIQFVILPAIALATEGLAVSLRLMRSSMLEELGKDYVRALRARGLKGRTIVWRRAARNAALPLISYGGIYFGALIGYSAIIEYLFRWPGLGGLLVSSVLQRDYPVALWVALVLTTTVILANFLANVAYGFVDPRIRQGGGAR
jgi:peptide/nickel transport system permease protein